MPVHLIQSFFQSLFEIGDFSDEMYIAKVIERMSVPVW